MNKLFNSPNYNFVFDNETGLFARWGKTLDDDPSMSSFGPEILDIEVSTICHKGCSFCYKSNTANGTNMSFDMFKSILDKMPNTLTQIAFGIGSVDANPDLWKMMEYTRSKGIVPNITINGERMTRATYNKLASLCGAVAVSLYGKEACYDSVYNLTERGLNQVNIHALLSKETYDKCLQVISDRKTDPRLAKMKAIVFLWLKPKGERNTNQSVTNAQFSALISMCMSAKQDFGFDSCTAPMFLEAVKYDNRIAQLKTMCEPCESTLFSYYVNAKGQGFPCSFSECGEGVNVAECNDFLKDVWFAEKTKEFRSKLLACDRKCPMYKLEL